MLTVHILGSLLLRLEVLFFCNQEILTSQKVLILLV